jgi:hypothetical protein
MLNDFTIKIKINTQPCCSWLLLFQTLQIHIEHNLFCYTYFLLIIGKYYIMEVETPPKNKKNLELTVNNKNNSNILYINNLLNK